MKLYERLKNLQCVFDWNTNKCKALTEKLCVSCESAEEAKQKCKFYCDSHTHYIDKKTRFVGDIKDGIKIPLEYGKRKC